jgi:hypothetical protein
MGSARKATELTVKASFTSRSSSFTHGPESTCDFLFARIAFTKASFSSVLFQGTPGVLQGRGVAPLQDSSRGTDTSQSA